jgi:hypothetical protein
MNSIIKTIISVLLGAGIYMSAQAAADGRSDYRPQRCTIDHDHRSHNTSYYDYYPADNYYRAGSYRGARATHDAYGRRGHANRGGYGRSRSRVVNRESYPTRWHARIVLVEEVYRTRNGHEQLVCSVLAKGPEAYYVPHRRLKRVARRDCSRSARIQYL